MHDRIETGDATRGQAIQLRSVFHGRRSPVQTRLERAAGSHDLNVWDCASPKGRDQPDEAVSSSKSCPTTTVWFLTSGRPIPKFLTRRTLD
ncbi:hypothetical protein chiPu_0026713 [Chiloscyllium punctatum]|uniref:Uncharacterized protein n=1 Tax=Chiloscyllium punctatum TaxID=137246 RepID=A0A401TJE8_CHIPU|nr:hypothetical protein [Chiloscyllium punctatum]